MAQLNFFFSLILKLRENNSSRCKLLEQQWLYYLSVKFPLAFLHPKETQSNPVLHRLLRDNHDHLMAPVGETAVLFSFSHVFLSVFSFP